MNYDEFLSFVRPEGASQLKDAPHVILVAGFELWDDEDARLARLTCEHATRWLSEFCDDVWTYGFESADTTAGRIYGSPFNVGELLGIREIELKKRLRLLDALATPYRCMTERFPDLGFTTSLHMLWDCVCESFLDRAAPYEIPEDGDPYDRPLATLDGDLGAVHEKIMAVLEDLLGLPSEQDWIQESALHGLGHSRHPRARDIVQRFIDTAPDLDTWNREWLEQCRDGRCL